MNISVSQNKEAEVQFNTRPLVLFVTNALNTGGPTIRIMELAFALMNRDKYRCAVYTLRTGGDMVPMYRDRKIPLIEPKGGGSKAVLKSFRLDTAWKLRQALRHLRPSLIHAVGTLADYHTKLALIGSSIPLITNINSEKWGWQRHFHRRFLHGLMASRTNRFLCVSRLAERGLHRAFPSTSDRSVVVHTGIGTTHMRLPEGYDRETERACLGYPKGSFVFGGLGRLHRFKGFDLLVRAFAALKPRWPEAVLAVAGWGPLEPELRRLADELGVDKVIVFLGRIPADQVARVLSTFDAYVVPTREAGFDNTGLEGIYMGLPSVVSEHSGIGEALESGKEVLLVPPEESALCQAMERIITDPKLRSQLAQAGQQQVRSSLTIEKYAAKIEQLYEEVLSERKR